MKQVQIYTDGACTGNPGRGGYAAILIYGERRKTLSGGFRLTTNNRMEMMAVIAALEQLKYSCDLTIYSDSRYLVQAFNDSWLEKWQNNGWRNARGEPVANVDLWQRLLDLLAGHQYRFVWIKGHSGQPENCQCDQLAVAACQAGDLPADEQYEAENPV
ncbi:MAG: ribonuclease HI [Negativicutes bacterium]|nr:ribonuclease HI [Negativicutes bacterium]